MKSDTPRTDDTPSQLIGVVEMADIERARQLERELAAAKEELDKEPKDLRIMNSNYLSVYKRLALYQEYYEAHMAMEFAVADFTLQHEQVARLERARAAIAQEKK